MSPRVTEPPLSPRDWLVAAVAAIGLVVGGWLFIVAASALAGRY